MRTASNLRAMRRGLPLVLSASLALASGGPSPAAEAAPKPLRVLLVTGGCCHDYDAQKTLIKDGLEERAHVEVTVVQQGGSATDSKIPLYEDADWAAGYDVVIHDECFSDAKDPQWTERILKPHREGLPAVVVHCAMHCYRDGSDEWFKFCGVTSRRHGAHYPHEVLNRDAEHPVMAGFGPSWDNPAGELYWIEKVWPTAHPLASAKNRENGQEEVCVWTNEYGKARVFGTTLGHHNETVSHPAFLELLTRGTLWACGKLDDEYLKPAKPKFVPVNLAKGKAAKASSEETGKGNLAAKAVDGDPKTRWCANGPGSGEWLQVDLGKAQPVTGCRLEWENSGAVYKYVIESSADGESWKTLVDASNGRGSQKSVDTFDARELRSLRITYLGSNTGSWGSLWEVQVFGEEMVEVQPRETSHAADAALLGDIKIPEGFEATLFAAPPSVNYPVSVAAAPDGTLYVAVDKNGSIDRQPNRGAIYRLRDVDGDGRADEVRLFVANVDSPRGLVWDHDRLYVMHPPHVSAFIDEDGDGIVDRQKVLVKNIAFMFKDRPADHTSNGVTLGIDGWLYLAIGDFGFMEALGADGRRLQMRGGGVVRIRPDGTEMEIYSRGTRNILEVAVDPLLNGFTRDNTNDGGGWDIRLHHFSGMEHHGYPSLYMNFVDEIVQPLADYGGGSGCGALYLDEPGFPAGYGNALYTADWGREWVYRHRPTPKGATFSVDQSEFVRVPRVTDLDADAMSRIYVASWKGATFTYAGENVGYLVRVTPKGYTPEPLPDFETASDEELANLLESPSHRRRLEAQRALVRRKMPQETAMLLARLAGDEAKPLASRVAAIFALKQGWKSLATSALTHLTRDRSIREYAIRALGDRKGHVSSSALPAIVNALRDENPRVRLAAVIALARSGDTERAADATPLLADSDPLVAHTAVQALIELRAVDACLAVLDRADATSAERTGAQRVLQGLHIPPVVRELIRRLEREQPFARRREVLSALCRLHFREGEWKGESWGTRPDTSGPYYQHAAWPETPKIAAALSKALKKADADEAAHLIAELNRHKIELDGSLETMLDRAGKDPTVIPAVVGQLARSRQIPAAGIPLLVRVTDSEDTSDAVRAQAVAALVKLGTADAFRAVLAALPRLDRQGGDRRDFERARDAFVRADALDQHHEVFATSAAARDGAESAWADAALLTISTREKVSPEARAAATKALEAGWADAPRRAQILDAARRVRHEASKDRILAALTDSDAGVTEAAKRAAAELRIDTKTASKPSGPRLETLKPEDVLATIQDMQADPRHGETLFNRLSCNKCHTVRADEPLRGPYLVNVAKTYKRRELAEAVLLPSKTIAQGFVTNVFALDSGKTFTGFVVQEGAETVVIRDNEGKEHELPAASIEERVKQASSVMPEGIVRDLTVEEFAALVAYLESLAGK